MLDIANDIRRGDVEVIGGSAAGGGGLLR